MTDDLDDIAAMRADGDLKDFLLSLTATPPAKPEPAPLAAVPAPAYRITHPGGWPLGTAATGPTPPPDQCTCAKCTPAPATRNHEGEAA